MFFSGTPIFNSVHRSFARTKSAGSVMWSNVPAPSQTLPRGQYLNARLVPLKVDAVDVRDLVPPRASGFTSFAIHTASLS